jgi:hypothetical protein
VFDAYLQVTFALRGLLREYRDLWGSGFGIIEPENTTYAKCSHFCLPETNRATSMGYAVKVSSCKINASITLYLDRAQSRERRGEKEIFVTAQRKNISSI